MKNPVTFVDDDRSNKKNTVLVYVNPESVDAIIPYTHRELTTLVVHGAYIHVQHNAEEVFARLGMTYTQGVVT